MCCGQLASQADDLEYQRLLGLGAIVRRHQRLHEGGIVLDDPRGAPELMRRRRA